MDDALVARSALAAHGETLYSGDLTDGQINDERLPIRNPCKTLAG